MNQSDDVRDKEPSVTTTIEPGPSPIRKSVEQIMDERSLETIARMGLKPDNSHLQIISPVPAPSESFLTPDGLALKQQAEAEGRPRIKSIEQIMDESSLAKIAKMGLKPHQ